MPDAVEPDGIEDSATERNSFSGRLQTTSQDE